MYFNKDIDMNMNINMNNQQELESNKIYLDYISLLEKQKIKDNQFSNPSLLKEKFLMIFNYSCNLMKEIEINKKLNGIYIMEKLIESNE
jgi:hypothetical protein